ncbi:MAG: RNA-binding protein [Candidatus Harrisonbacteria bacterium CG10_big_fil_rev_8_21_14_0_10_44_23]|uniref:RNA-binding protein KhpA n=1 Tax=Candidatus Harrisonbacteria bacterium CG10_big_fil_rev_8_21_14_0_10_44_23 TaxID=1974585 RepID=A0A2H0UPP5_9BACT|nr:MAG: RNA-binding protein [Candidatus Harrisonbacteria bacterium CG10_big_fil_rev_8_21_14_0_10_44_23]
MESQDKEVLETILKAIVNQPEKVLVTRTTDEMGVLLTVKLGEGDAGVVIGKQGQSITAIRSVINIVGRKNQAKVNVKLDVPERHREVAGTESHP